MQDATWRETLDRLLLASGSSNETALASRLGISNQSVYNAKNKQQIPPSWIYEIAKTFSVSADWLFFGRGPMRHGEAAKPTEKTPETLETTTEAMSCARCAKLEAKLDALEEERRELAQENRQLLRENGDLKAKCAVLEERQKHCCPEPQVFEKLPNIPSSKTDLRA